MSKKCVRVHGTVRNTVNDNFCDRFIRGLRSQHVKQKLLSRNFTFQEAVNKAITQEAAQKDVKDIADSHGEKPVLAVTAVV